MFPSVDLPPVFYMALGLYFGYLRHYIRIHNMPLISRFDSLGFEQYSPGRDHLAFKSAILWKNGQFVPHLRVDKFSNRAKFPESEPKFPNPNPN